MKLKWIAVLGIFVVAAHVNAEDGQALKTQQERVSYGIGVDMVRNFKLQGVEFDLDILVRGMKDELSGQKLLLSEEELRATLNAYNIELKQKFADKMKAVAEENRKAGDAFLAENRTKEGVVTLPSGLQYKILKAGDGKMPTENDTVECNYRGTLIDGTEFDNSANRGRPAVLKVNAVIPGWREALKLMPIGSKWQLFIPPQLAYGERGAGRGIGPNATLIFEVELLAIK